MWFLLACGVDPQDPKPDDGPTTDDSGATLPDDCNASLPAEAGVVHTTSGAWRGVTVDGAMAWMGIRFAEPPVGDLRFSAPVPRACVPGVVDAAEMGSLCAQEGELGMEGSEDCLQLNVWAPAGASGDLPVLFFMHGGGNVSGGTALVESGVAYYDGAALAERMDAVVVTTNYRVGAFGFLAHPALAGADGENGNWGLLDQRLAMQWVQDNIAGFGGDPTQVLLFGESAGALDTCAHLASSGSDGLYAAALMESGACIAIPLADAEESAETHAETLGCGDSTDLAACLRAADAAAVAALSESPISEFGIPSVHSFGPTEDGVVLDGQPYDVLAAGGGADVPLVIGTNTDETSQWVPLLTDGEYESLVTLLVGSYADEVLEVYPVSAYDSARDAWIALSTDVSFTCPARTIARAVAERGGAPVYRYQFSKVPNGASGYAYGAWHGLELIYVFQHVEMTEEATGYRADEADPLVEAAMGASWRAFAATGVPDADALGSAWPEYDVATDPYFDFGDPLATGAGLRTGQCDFWDGFAR